MKNNRILIALAFISFMIGCIILVITYGSTTTLGQLVGISLTIASFTASYILTSITADKYDKDEE